MWSFGSFSVFAEVACEFAHEMSLTSRDHPVYEYRDYRYLPSTSRSRFTSDDHTFADDNRCSTSIELVDYLVIGGQLYS